MRKTAVASMLLAQLVLVASLRAQTFEPVFERHYTRDTGSPVTVTDAFSVCDPRGLLGDILDGNGTRLRRQLERPNDSRRRSRRPR